MSCFIIEFVSYIETFLLLSYLSIYVVDNFSGDLTIKSEKANICPCKHYSSNELDISTLRHLYLMACKDHNEKGEKYFKHELIKHYYFSHDRREDERVCKV